MRTYRELFAVAEYRVLFLNRCIVLLSVSCSSLALGTLTYEATRSPLWTGVAMFGGPLVALVTSHFLLAGSDLVRPRTALMCQMAGALTASGLQCVPGMPWQARLVILTIPYVVNSMFSGTQWVIVRQLVPAESFALARSTMNLAVGAMQVLGYAVGGVALMWLSARELFFVAAVADAVCLLNVRLGLKDRPATAQADGGVAKRTQAVNRLLLGSRLIRPLYLAMWLPTGLVAGCETLFIPAVGGARAGYLFAAAAGGMMIGDLAIGRWTTPALRARLLIPLRLIQAAPFLLFFSAPGLSVALILVAVASVGQAAYLPLQDALLGLAPESARGQALGLFSQGMMVSQALGALLAGFLAHQMVPTTAIGLLGVTGLAVMAALTPGLARSRRHSNELFSTEQGPARGRVGD